MNQKSDFRSSLQSHYREYVQFLNDLIIKQPATDLIVFFSNLTMIFNLTAKLNEQTGLLSNISLLGISNIVYEAAELSFAFEVAAGVILITIATSPFMLILGLLLESYLQSSGKHQIGSYRQRYENSSTHRALRFVFATFPYLLLPLATSVAVKHGFNSYEGDGFMGSLCLTIVVMVPISYLVCEYHSLDIHWQDFYGNDSILMRCNYPNNIIDTALVFGYILAVNLTQPHACFIISIVIFIMRIASNYFFPCYHKKLKQDHLSAQVSSTVFAIGVYLAYLSDQIFFTMCFVIFLMLILWRIKQVTRDHNQRYSQVKQQAGQLGIDQLKKHLWRDGLFTYVYRELIFLQRKNRGYRQDLIISILKQKCYTYELEARGGAKIVNSEDVMKFEKEFVLLLQRMLIIADKSVSILKLLQNKDAKPEIFAVEVQKLAEIINKNKGEIKKMFAVNQFSYEANELLQLLYRIIYNDPAFIKQIQTKVKQQVNSLLQKQAKLKLFSKKSSVVFINILDDVGKITKASKNLPSILGYSPHNLIGLSINQIIPFSIKPYHEEHLINFVKNYSKKTLRRDPKIQFYAYDKDFHIQHVIITYYFIMNYFSNFELSGVFRKVELEEDVIITDSYGNLEGWTAALGIKLGFDDIPMSDCRMYNIIPLIPALTKYLEHGQANLNTIVFKTTKGNNPSLMLMDYKKEPELDQDLWEKQIQSFRKMMANDEIVDIYHAHIQLSTVLFCSGHVKMRKIFVNSLQRIQNMLEIQQIIKDKLFRNNYEDEEESSVGGSKTEQKIDGQSSFVCDSNSKINRNFGYESTLQESSKVVVFDTNFSLDPMSNNLLAASKIRIEKQGGITVNITANDLEQVRESSTMEEQLLKNEELALKNKSNKNDSSFTPALQRDNNYTYLLFLLASIFMALLIYDQVMLNQSKISMEREFVQVRNRNRALMIYAKSVFNPNITYVNEFDKGSMVWIAEWLHWENVDFISYEGSTSTITKFYMFNTQIPSTLERAATAKPQQSYLQREIDYNFYSVIQLYRESLNKQQDIWKTKMDQRIVESILRLVFIGVGSFIYSVFIIYIYFQYRKQKKTTEAFFKFEKVDLQARIQKIHQSVQLSESRVVDWHLQKEFYQVVKKNDICNTPFKGYNNNFEEKIRFQISEEKQSSIGQRKFYIVLGFILIFMLSQIIFISFYAYLNFNRLAILEQAPIDLNQACKLIVLPNLQIASLFLPVPHGIIPEFSESVTKVLQKPVGSLPDLFPLLEEAPCAACTILYPFLTTNFRSYYSNFQQIIVEKKSLNNKNVSELWQSVDIVVERIMNVLTWKGLPQIWPIVLVYIVSLALFFISIYFGLKKMDEQKEKLEVFLKYFNEEVLTKNKHMNSLLNKNI